MDSAESELVRIAAMPTTTLDIASVGQAATWLQTSVTGIRTAAERLQIEPAVRINGIDHYHTEDVHRMAAQIEEMKTSAAKSRKEQGN